jgi:riboflavin biosynthesis pyrimidine reductase
MADPDPDGTWRLLHGPAAPRDVALTDLATLADLHAQPLTGGPPHVRANMVSTVDGAAAADGLSGDISPPADRVLFRVLRAAADAILVGAGTARDENYGPVSVPDPLVAWRAGQGLAPLPVVIQVTRSGRIHDGRDLLLVPGAAAVVTSSRDPAVLDRLAGQVGLGHVIRASGPSGELDVATMLRALAARGWRRVLCEGGPSLLATLLRAGAVDELCVTTSPTLLPVAAPRITVPSAATPSASTGRVAPQPTQLVSLAVTGSTVFTRWGTA